MRCLHFFLSLGGSKTFQKKKIKFTKNISLQTNMKRLGDIWYGATIVCLSDKPHNTYTHTVKYHPNHFGTINNGYNEEEKKSNTFNDIFQSPSYKMIRLTLLFLEFLFSLHIFLKSPEKETSTAFVRLQLEKKTKIQLTSGQRDRQKN